MKRAAPEQSLHKAVMQFLRLALPGDAFVTTFPLGGGGYWHGARQKAVGTVKGFPDVLIIWNAYVYCIELKAASGRVSDVQAQCHARLTQAGAKVSVVRSLDELEQQLFAWAIPSRATRRAA